MRSFIKDIILFIGEKIREDWKSRKEYDGQDSRIRVEEKEETYFDTGMGLCFTWREEHKGPKR